MTLTEIVDQMTQSLEMRGLDKDLAAELVRVLIAWVIKVLEQGDEVKIKGLGRFYWAPCRARTIILENATHKVPACHRLRFRPAETLRRREMAKEEKEDAGMTKLGVQLDQDKTKTASQDPQGGCPICHQKLDDAGACPTHGTEPLEARK